MTKYQHDLPKHPTRGYPLAALTEADARTEYAEDAMTRARSWHCACAAPQYDAYTRGSIAFSEFCCGCGKPSARTLEAVVREAMDAACRCPDGYTVLGVHAEGIAAWVRYRGPEGYEVSYHAGDAPLRGDHAMALHAELLLAGRRAQSDKGHGGERAGTEEIRRALTAAFNEHEALRGRFDFIVSPSSDSEYTTPVTAIMDGDFVFSAFGVYNRTYTDLEAEARSEARLTVQALEERMRPETCPACDGHLELCSECGGKGWVPAYRASEIRVEQEAPPVPSPAIEQARSVAPKWAQAVVNLLAPSTTCIAIFTEDSTALRRAIDERKEQFHGFGEYLGVSLLDAASLDWRIKQPLEVWYRGDCDDDAVIVVGSDRVAIMKNRGGSCRVVSRTDEPYFMGADDPSPAVVEAAARQGLAPDPSFFQVPTKPPGYTFRIDGKGGGVWVTGRRNYYYYGPREREGYDMHGLQRNADPTRWEGAEEARQWCAHLLGVTAPTLRGAE